MGDRHRRAVRPVLRRHGRDPLVANPEELSPPPVAEADEPPRHRHPPSRPGYRRRAAAAALARHRHDDDLPALRDGDGRPLRVGRRNGEVRSEEHTSEVQSLMRISYAVFCLKKKKKKYTKNKNQTT